MTIDAGDIHGNPEVQSPSSPLPRSEAVESASAETGRNSMDRNGVGKEARRRIGRNLRILYADVLDMPLPDRFETLLAELSAQPAAREIS